MSTSYIPDHIVDDLYGEIYGEKLEGDAPESELELEPDLSREELIANNIRDEYLDNGKLCISRRGKERGDGFFCPVESCSVTGSLQRVRLHFGEEHKDMYGDFTKVERYPPFYPSSLSQNSDSDVASLLYKTYQKFVSCGDLNIIIARIERIYKMISKDFRVVKESLRFLCHPELAQRLPKAINDSAGSKEKLVFESFMSDITDKHIPPCLFHMYSRQISSFIYAITAFEAIIDSSSEMRKLTIVKMDTSAFSAGDDRYVVDHGKASPLHWMPFGETSGYQLNQDIIKTLPPIKYNCFQALNMVEFIVNQEIITRKFKNNFQQNRADWGNHPIAYNKSPLDIEIDWQALSSMEKDTMFPVIKKTVDLLEHRYAKHAVAMTSQQYPFKIDDSYLGWTTSAIIVSKVFSKIDSWDSFMNCSYRNICVNERFIRRFAPPIPRATSTWARSKLYLFMKLIKEKLEEGRTKIVLDWLIKVKTFDMFENPMFTDDLDNVNLDKLNISMFPPEPELERELDNVNLDKLNASTVLPEGEREREREGESEREREHEGEGEGELERELERERERERELELQLEVEREVERERERELEREVELQLERERERERELERELELQLDRKRKLELEFDSSDKEIESSESSDTSDESIDPDEDETLYSDSAKGSHEHLQTSLAGSGTDFIGKLPRGFDQVPKSPVPNSSQESVQKATSFERSAQTTLNMIPKIKSITDGLNSIIDRIENGEDAYNELRYLIGLNDSSVKFKDEIYRKSISQEPTWNITPKIKSITDGLNSIVDRIESGEDAYNELRGLIHVNDSSAKLKDEIYRKSSNHTKRQTQKSMLSAGHRKRQQEEEEANAPRSRRRVTRMDDIDRERQQRSPNSSFSI